MKVCCIQDLYETQIARIAAAVPAPTETFLLTALTESEAIADQHRRCGTTAVQHVDYVAEPELRRLRKRSPGTRLVQVIHVVGPESVDEARVASALVDALLLDSGNPRLAVKELGGTGRVHDWEHSRRIRESVGVPVLLAGGLHSGNARAAMQQVEPAGLDVCSGLRLNGRLDAGKLRDFFSALH